ncbi:MAG: WhiB family transcriptional regulator [Candidatus Saccharibacteria bacterium]
MRAEQQMSTAANSEISRPAAVQAMREGVHWGSLAACAEPEVSPEIFELAGEKSKLGRECLELARAVCGRCVVIEECLAETMAFKDFSLFRAGLTDVELQTLARRNARKAASNRRAG